MKDFDIDAVLEQVRRYIDHEEIDELRRLLVRLDRVRVLDLLRELSPKELIIAFSLIPKSESAELFSKLKRSQRDNLLSGMTIEEMKSILSLLNVDDKVDVLGEMPANIVRRILMETSPSERDLINRLLLYPKHSAGSLMTVEYVQLGVHMTVGESLAVIRQQGVSSETVYTNYVLDEGRKLVGIISLRQLVLADEAERIEDLMERRVVAVHTLDDQEQVAQVFSEYGYLALPVLDKEGRMTGIITIDDIMEVVEQEATEDFQIMAAMSPSEESYKETSVWTHAKKRIGWLLILMISATFTGRIMSTYSEVLESAIILSVFIPMLMDTGGNSGSQASTLIIRGLATHELRLKDWAKVLAKEFRIAIIVGVVLSAVNYARLVFVEGTDQTVALVVSLTTIATVLLSKTVGSMLPIGAKALKLDPAIMAAPLITTIVDAMSLLIYFYIATSLLPL